jgi:hypothetical protein
MWAAAQGPWQRSNTRVWVLLQELLQLELEDTRAELEGAVADRQEAQGQLASCRGELAGCRDQVGLGGGGHLTMHSLACCLACPSSCRVQPLGAC